MDRASLYRFGAAGVLAGAAAFELGRIATNTPWRGFLPWISHLASAALALLFLSTATAVIASRFSVRAARAAGVLATLAVPIMVAHAMVTRVGGTIAGLAYVAVAAVVGWLVVRALQHSGMRLTRTEERGRNAPSAA
jgi:hypothetical protein